MRGAETTVRRGRIFWCDGWDDRIPPWKKVRERFPTLHIHASPGSSFDSWQVGFARFSNSDDGNSVIFRVTLRIEVPDDPPDPWEDRPSESLPDYGEHIVKVCAYLSPSRGGYVADDQNPSASGPFRKLADWQEALAARFTMVETMLRLGAVKEFRVNSYGET